MACREKALHSSTIFSTIQQRASKQNNKNWPWFFYCRQPEAVFLSIMVSPHTLKSEQKTNKTTNHHQKNQWVHQTEVSDGCTSAAEEDTVLAYLYINTFSKL